MIEKDVVDRNLRRCGWNPVSEQPAGFVGVRLEVENMESGDLRLADILYGSSDSFTYPLTINVGYARDWSPSYTTGAIKTGWLEHSTHLGYQILSIDASAKRLTQMTPLEYSESPQDACRTMMQLVKCVEWIARNQCCHLAICPSSVYFSDGKFLLGELWYCRLANGEPFLLSTENSDLILDAIPKEAQLYSAPELTNDRRRISRLCDGYSLALLTLNVFAGYVPDGSIENSTNRRATIRDLCPALDHEIAGKLANCLHPDPGLRGDSVDLKYAFAAFGERIGIPLSQEYLAKAF